MHKTSRGNPRAFHGTKKHGPYFEGWYLKHQAESGTSLALIPALHMDAAGQASTSLQVVTEGKSWWLEYPAAGDTSRRIGAAPSPAPISGPSVTGLDRSRAA